MARFFTPPSAPTRLAAVNPGHPGFGLFRHFRPYDAGINVWLMPGNVLTTVEPAFESDAVRVFHGGHIHPVDDATAALLVAAGFTVFDAPVVVPSSPLPGFVDVTSVATGPAPNTYTDVYAGSY